MFSSLYHSIILVTDHQSQISFCCPSFNLFVTIAFHYLTKQWIWFANYYKVLKWYTSKTWSLTLSFSSHQGDTRPICSCKWQNVSCHQIHPLPVLLQFVEAKHCLFVFFFFLFFVFVFVFVFLQWKNLLRRPINFSSTFHPSMFCSPKLQNLRIATKCLVKYCIKKNPSDGLVRQWPNNISPSSNNPCLWSPFSRPLSYLPMRVVGN